MSAQLSMERMSEVTLLPELTPASRLPLSSLW